MPEKRETLRLYFKSGNIVEVEVEAGSVKWQKGDGAYRPNMLTWVTVGDEPQLLHADLDEVEAVVVCPTCAWQPMAFPTGAQGEDDE